MFVLFLGGIFFGWCCIRIGIGIGFRIRFCGFRLGFLAGTQSQNYQNCPNDQHQTADSQQQIFAGYGTFDTGDCRVEGYPDSEAAAALRSAMSEISVQRYYRLPTSLFSRFTQNWNYATIWWIPEDGQKHDLYLNWDEGFIYDDANRAVAYKIDGDAQQVFSELCAVISEYGTYTR